MKKFMEGKRTRLIPVLAIAAVLLSFAAVGVAAWIGTARSTTNCQEIEELKGFIRLTLQDSIRNSQEHPFPGLTAKERQDLVNKQIKAYQRFRAQPCPREHT